LSPLRYPKIGSGLNFSQPAKEKQTLRSQLPSSCRRVKINPVLNGRPTIKQDFEIWINFFAPTISGKLNKKVIYVFQYFDIKIRHLARLKLLKKNIKKEGHISIRKSNKYTID
jgi:hypothetical protein